MNNRSHYRSRYEEKIASMIPSDWEITRLGDCAEIIISNVDKKTLANELPVRLCNYTDVYYNEKLTNSINYMAATASLAEIKKFSLKKGDVIITKDSETADDIAVPSYVAEDLEGVLCGYHLALIRPNKTIIIGEYIQKLFQLHIYRYYFSVLANGVTRFGLNSEATLSAQIPLPPLPEQQRIVGILASWDSAIEKMERLIKTKEKQLKYLINKLVNDKTYPKAFVRNVATELSTRNNGEQCKRVLSVTNINGFVLPEIQFERRVASEDLSNYKLVRRGQYAYNPSRINVGSIARLDNWPEGALSPMYVVFSLNENKINSDFFQYWLYSYEARERIKRSSQGSVRETVSFQAFGDIAIPLPPLDTQLKITALLNVAKEEIDLLKKQLEALRKQKRGLMQKLLTGEWRLKTATEEE